MKDIARLEAHLNNGETEYIMCSAIYYNDGVDHIFKPYNIDKGLVYGGWRHSNVFETMPKGHISGSIQGFLTTKNRFLTRKEALVLVKENGQLTKPIIGGELTSEDLW